MNPGLSFIASCVAACLFGAPLAALAEANTACGPFPASAARPVAAPAESASSGAAGVQPGVAPGGPGAIVPMPAETAAGAAGAAAPPSEAILALPKDAAGAISSEFELGQGVEITESFFSPVICATVARVSGPPGMPLDQLVPVVPEGSAVVANDVYALVAAEVTPANAAAPGPDPYADYQYGLAITGVRAAREISTGEGVTIALLDSAPDASHLDLAGGQMRTHPGDAAEPPPVGVHGTLMAGLISATENNGFGIAGIAPGAKLVSIPSCRPAEGAGGRCTIYSLLRGLDLAWNAEAQIVNLSLSGPPNILLERGVTRLEELGAVVVAAAGNAGTTERRYPAAYPSVVSVGAVDREGRLFPASNRGPWVELMAPGVDVLSTVPGSAFAFGNGTSLAAAHVSGALAVLTSVTQDPRAARGALFRAAGTSGEREGLPQVCDVLADLGRPCEAATP